MAKKNKKQKIPFLLRFMGWLFPILEKYLPFLAKKLFVQIFFTPAHYPYPEKELACLRTASKKRIFFKGRKVQVYQWGNGKPILMIHGWMGRATQFRKFIPVLNAAGYSVIAFDAPAHGKSAGIKSHLMYFVQVAEQLAQEYNFEAIVGHSLGGVAGMHVVQRGTDIPKLIMIGSPSIADEIIGEFLRRLNGSWKSGLHFKKYIEKTYGIPFENYSATYVVQKIENLSLLLIYDEDDIEVPISHGNAIKALYPGAELFITKGLGHTRTLKDEKIIDRCLDFIIR